MALNTRNQRASGISMGRPGLVTMPLPDDLIDYADRLQLAYLLVEDYEAYIRLAITLTESSLYDLTLVESSFLDLGLQEVDEILISISGAN